MLDRSMFDTISRSEFTFTAELNRGWRSRLPVLLLLLWQKSVGLYIESEDIYRAERNCFEL